MTCASPRERLKTFPDTRLPMRKLSIGRKLSLGSFFSFNGQSQRSKKNILAYLGEADQNQSVNNNENASASKGKPPQRRTGVYGGRVRFALFFFLSRIVFLLNSQIMNKHVCFQAHLVLSLLQYTRIQV